MTNLMTRCRFTIPYATMTGTPSDPEWARQIGLEKMFVEGECVSLPVSLQDLDRGYTTIPHVLYDAIHPTVDRGPIGTNVTNGLVFAPGGMLHIHRLSREDRQGMLESFIQSNPSSAEIIRNLVQIR